MLRFKVNPMSLLKDQGWTNQKLLDGGYFGNATMQKMRHCKMVSARELDVICGLLNCQPGELLEYVPSTEADE